VVAPASGQAVFNAGFQRDVNRYRWTADTDVKARQGAWEIGLRNAFQSDAFLLFDDRVSFRDEDRFRIDAMRRGAGRTHVAVRSRSDWFSLSRVYHQDTWVGLRHESAHGWWVEPAAGLALDARPGVRSGTGPAPVRTDAGPAAGVTFGLPASDISGYLSEITATAQFQRLSPRAGRLLRTRARSERTFDRARLSAELEASSIRRDAYQAASFLNRDDATARRAETVESTRNDTVFVTLGLQSQVTSRVGLDIRLDAGTNSRYVRTLRAPDDALVFDSNFRRRTVQFDMAGNVSVLGSGYIRMAVQAGAEVERRQLDNAADLPTAQATQKLNLLRQADNDRGFVGLSLSGLMPLTQRLRVQFDGSVNLLQHDTPEVNPDDRDELLYNGSLGIEYRVTPRLAFSTRLAGSYFHTVYLKAARSADNNEQTSIRLRPAIDWKPGDATRIRLSSEVRATYTVDDFLLPGRRPTDQSAREMRYDLDASHEVGGGLRLLVTASYSDLRLGRFLDNVFAEIPFDTLRTYSGWVRIQTSGRIQAEVGVRYFIRSDYERSATLRYTRSFDGEDAAISRSGRTRIDQIGPTTAITWPMRRGTYLRLDGWVTSQRVATRLYGDVPEDFRSDIRRAERSGQHTLIPNLSVSMLVYF